MSLWPMALVRRIDRSHYACSAARNGLLADVCQHLYLLGWTEDADRVKKLRTISKAIALVLTAHGMRRTKGTRAWRVPPADVVAFAAAHEKTYPRRAWHAKNDRRRTYSPQEVAILLAARHKVGYWRLARMLRRTPEQIRAWYRRREGRKKR